MLEREIKKERETKKERLINKVGVYVTTQKVTKYSRYFCHEDAVWNKMTKKNIKKKNGIFLREYVFSK